MKKNNKGFFLAETIIVVALITTVMAFVYPNVSKLYENYVNRVRYYDQPQDLFALRAISDLFDNEYIHFVDKPGELNPNNVFRVNLFGYFTYVSKNEVDTTSSISGAGCRIFEDGFKIYEKDAIYVSTGKFKSIGLGLDEIRSKVGGGSMNNNDYFTCYGDYYGQNNSYNLDMVNGAGRSCTNTKNKYKDFFDKINLSELYITGYMSNPTSSDYYFNRYLKRMKKTNYDKASYRLIGVFEKKDIYNNVIEVRYASIKIENPNPNRTCNLGGS